jgi:hypothetical protein
MNQARLDTARSVVSVVGTIVAGRAALQRIRQASSDDDRLEMLDAAIHVVAVITGLLVIIRRLRRGQDVA